MVPDLGTVVNNNLVKWYLSIFHGKETLNLTKFKIDRRKCLFPPLLLE